MEKKDRKAQILHILKNRTQAISASTLAKEFHVSRQSIVGDVALLRAQGHLIEATARGYIWPKDENSLIHTIQSNHKPNQTRLELEILVKNHIEIIDVWVDHPVYEHLKGSLNIKTEKDIDLFLAKKTPLLLTLTEGCHFHTLRANSQKDLDNALKELKYNGFIIKVS